MPPWTKDNVTVVPAPIAGKYMADALLQRYYESSPTALKDIPMTKKEEGDITWYHLQAMHGVKTSK